MTSWKIDTTHATIHFVVRHMLVGRVRGRFNRWRGELCFDDASPLQGTASAHVDADSVDTNDRQRDAHLRSADFLDVARFPAIAFRSTRVGAAGDHRFVLAGELTLRGVTREVALDVEYHGRMCDPDGHERLGFTAHTTINRRAFGVTFNQVLDAGGLALGDKVEIEIEVEAVSHRGAPAPQRVVE